MQLLRNGVRYVDVAKPTQADDGGSSAEIKRVLGGPSIGDIRYVQGFPCFGFKSNFPRADPGA